MSVGAVTSESGVVLQLNSKGTYVDSEASLALRGFPCKQMTDLLKLRTSSDDTALIRKFQGWCRRRRKS